MSKASYSNQSVSRHTVALQLKISARVPHRKSGRARSQQFEDVAGIDDIGWSNVAIVSPFFLILSFVTW